MRIIDLFNISLKGRASREAVEYDLKGGGTEALTFGDLDARSERVAALLAAHGLSKGDRLAFFLANRIEFVDFFLACVKLGVIAVPINILYREREIGHIIADAEPALVVSSGDLIGHLPPGTPAIDVEGIAAGSLAGLAAPGEVQIDGDDPAAIVYTSGTTGRSKGAILTHNNFLSNTVNLTACWRIDESDRYLAVLPLFHVHGLGNGIHSWLASGCSMRLAERFDASKAADLFDSYKPTIFFGVPTVYVRLLELPGETARSIGARMRLFVSGSAPLPAQVLEEFRAKFGHTILERYGMSETLMNIGNPYAGERRPGSVGLPFPGVQVRILGPALEPVAVGETGELFIQGPNVCAGYWRREDATQEAFVDIPGCRGKWFRTGDLAQVSPDGYYTLCGRRSDLIISGGFNIYPREIEELLLEQPGVREAAVRGVPDARRGELPCAWIVADEPFDPGQLEDACRRSLASFKVPRAFIRVDSLPRNALGKVQKHLLPAPEPDKGRK